jgi:hypothetical protein
MAQDRIGDSSADVGELFRAIADWGKWNAFERSVKVPMSRLIRICIEDCRPASVSVVKMLSVTVAVITPGMSTFAWAMRVRLISMMVAMYMRMIATLMAMVDHGTKGNLLLGL